MPALATNQNYIMELYQERDGGPLSVKANIPEQVGFGIQSEWEARLPSNIDSMVGAFASAVSRSASLLGGSTTFQLSTFQSWRGTTPIEITLELGFRAWSDAQQDVIEPMKRLTQMAAPGVFAGFMTSPGPSPLRPNRNRLMLRLGRFLLIPSMVITRVEHTFSSMMAADGTPTAGKSDVTLMTIDTPSADMILGYFGPLARNASTQEAYAGSQYDIGAMIAKAVRDLDSIGANNAATQAAIGTLNRLRDGLLQGGG